MIIQLNNSASRIRADEIDFTLASLASSRNTESKKKEKEGKSSKKMHEGEGKKGRKKILIRWLSMHGAIFKVNRMK